MSLGGKGTRKRKLDDLPRPKPEPAEDLPSSSLSEPDADDDDTDQDADDDMKDPKKTQPASSTQAPRAAHDEQEDPKNEPEYESHEDPKKTRLYFDPKDRILFLHHGCNRVFEGVVKDVDRQYANIEIIIPIQRIPKSKAAGSQGSQGADGKDETMGKHWKQIEIKLDAYRGFQDYELISLFRPAFFQMNAPPGFYLNHTETGLWLDLDDIFEIIEQGGHVEGDATSETYNPTVFVARVTAVNEITCRIVPTHAPTPPPIPTNQSRSQHRHVTTTEMLANVNSASGFVHEWVPRNTLRFRRFITKSRLRAQSLSFTLVPSTTSTTSYPEK